MQKYILDNKFILQFHLSKIIALKWVLLFILFWNFISYSQGFSTLQPIGTVTAAQNTEIKPQSKVWEYDGYWWAVISVTTAPAGAYIWRLDNGAWTQQIKISDRTDVIADTRQYNDFTYIVLSQWVDDLNATAKSTTPDVFFIEVKYNSGTTSYDIINSKTLTLYPKYEAVTLDIDTEGRIWIAADGEFPVNERVISVIYSNPYDYTVWNGPIILESGIYIDDICIVTSFEDGEGNKIGVMWSDQNSKRFGFRYHLDSGIPGNWSNIEIPASGISPNGNGVADDHMNFAIDKRNKMLYAAVKTGYDYTSGTVDSTTLGLLARKPNGTWTKIFRITGYDEPGGAGTRPLVVLSELNNILTIAYTQKTGANDIVYKETPIYPNINLEDVGYKFLTYGSTKFNNVSSTKQNYNDKVVFVFSNLTNWEGVLADRTTISSDVGAGYAVNLNGTDQYVRFLNSTASLNVGNYVTVEAWIKPNLLKDQIIFSKKLTSTSGYQVDMTIGGNITFSVNGFQLSSNPLIIADGQTWTHIACTYNPTSMNIYINGKRDNFLTSSFPAIVSNSVEPFIGAKPDKTKEFDGNIDEVRVWNIARSELEIQANMSQKISPSSSGILGYWRFDNPNGLTVPDLTINHNDGSMYNMQDFSYVWSGANIGDQSVFDYTGTGGVFTQSLSHPDGDFLTVSTTSGSIQGLQVYRTDGPGMRPPVTDFFSGSTSPFPNTDSLRYWGVKVIGSGSPTYDIVYNYNGHPSIVDESALKVAFRENLADNSWEDLVATLNVGQHTLSKAGLTGTEFALASIESNLLSVRLKVFLEGPYNGSGMDTVLNTFLPTSQPYNTLPWDYAGAESVASGFFTTHTDILDWVLLELRTGTASVTKVATRAAFLKSDGTIVDIDGLSPVLFTGLSAADYYIVIRHRNHLAVMSANAISLSGSSSLYDFTTAQAKAYGTNAMKDLLGNATVFGMFGGDGNGDGFVTAGDKNIYWFPQNGTIGYLSGDFNIDSFVTAGDKNLIWFPNNGLVAQIP